MVLSVLEPQPSMRPGVLVVRESIKAPVGLAHDRRCFKPWCVPEVLIGLLVVLRESSPATWRWSGTSRGMLKRQ
jgi:hypothetical protein